MKYHDCSEACIHMCSLIEDVDVNSGDASSVLLPLDQQRARTEKFHWFEYGNYLHSIWNGRKSKYKGRESKTELFFFLWC